MTVEKESLFAVEEQLEKNQLSTFEQAFGKITPEVVVAKWVRLGAFR
jgi:ribosomal protein S7